VPTRPDPRNSADTRAPACRRRSQAPRARPPSPGAHSISGARPAVSSRRQRSQISSSSPGGRSSSSAGSKGFAWDGIPYVAAVWRSRALVPFNFFRRPFMALVASCPSPSQPCTVGSARPRES
jgi:hypothetical protein